MKIRTNNILNSLLCFMALTCLCFYTSNQSIAADATAAEQTNTESSQAPEEPLSSEIQEKIKKAEEDFRANDKNC